MDVIILTEGGKDYGFGHVARCSSIYQAFLEYGISPKFIINGDESVKSILKDIPFEVNDWLNNFDFPDSSDIVIMDSYLANFEFYEKISSKYSLTVYIDDNNRLEYPKGIIVNGTLDVANMNYSKREEVLYLVGKDFVPLRRDFWNISTLKVKGDVENILITMGGNDLRNLTPKILDLLNIHYPNIIKKVIIADSFKNTFEIELLKNDNVELIYSPNSKKIAEVMSDIDLAISASGQTLYELACVGIPTIAIGIIENQVNNVKNWQKIGFIEYAGCWNNERLLDNILEKMDYLKDKNVRKDKNLIGTRAIDGKGSLRIAKNILSEYYKKYSIFREIKEDDCLKIFEIANDDEVRQSSFNSDKIELDDHKKWFKNILQSDSTKFYVLEFNEDIIGQIRFDFDDEFPVISISLNKKYRGLGLSKYLLYKGLESDKNGKLVAYIKQDNLKSIALFKSLGFERENEVTIKGCDAFRFIKE